MAKQRMVDTRFWDDSYIVTLAAPAKLLYLYLLTNPLTSIAGVYEISLGRMALDTALPEEAVREALERFIADRKVAYVDGWLAVGKWLKHQKDNPKVQRGIELALEEAPDSLSAWVRGGEYPEGYSIDSLSIDYACSIDSLSHPNPNPNPNPNSNVLPRKASPGGPGAELSAALEDQETGEREDPELADDAIPERYHTVLDTVRRHYGLGLRASHLKLLEDLFRHHAYPSTVCEQIRKVKEREEGRGKPAPADPVSYVHSYMRKWTKTMGQAEQERASKPAKTVPKCPGCGAELSKAGDLWACPKCAKRWESGENGRLKEFEKVQLGAERGKSEQPAGEPGEELVF